MAAAPEWQVAGWLNGPGPASLAALRGRVVLALAFQMLCPGCAAHAVPQALRVRAAFPEEDVVVLGLHTVFEHHAGQGSEASLAAFLHEYRVDFPVARDLPDAAGMPCTMGAYAMRGTPTLLAYDRAGQLRLRQFGHVDDIALGALLGRLAAAPA